jgi:hypothetical protein
MSYADYLRTKQINQPKVIDKKMHIGDASTYIWRTKLAASTVRRPTDHVITNESDPFLVTTGANKPTVYKGTGQGGKVQDASLYTLSLGAKSIGQDKFSVTKQIISGGTGTNCLASPAPSLIINPNGNYDGKKTGLNMGATLVKCPAVFNPLTKSHFVDTIPDLQTRKVDGSLPVGCTSTTTTGNWSNKSEVAPNLHPKGPPKTDFRTAVMGPQVSPDGRYGRAPKVGGPVESYYLPTSPEHHGLAKGPDPVPTKFKPTTGAPAQKKINGPQHYPVA